MPDLAAPTGIAVYFLEPGLSQRLGQQLLNHATQATTGLTVPQAPKLVVAR